MAKAKTYRYEGETSAVIAVPGTGGVIPVEPGETIEATTDAEVAAFDANPDLVKAKKEKK